jgi:hypothetical protein
VIQEIFSDNLILKRLKNNIFNFFKKFITKNTINIRMWLILMGRSSVIMGVRNVYCHILKLMMLLKIIHSSLLNFLMFAIRALIGVNLHGPHKSQYSMDHPQG